MKIVMPVDDKTMETSVCQSFGRTPYFLIYETETKEHTFIDNSGAASQGGAGIKAAQVIVDQKAEVLLTPRCGENAAEVIKAANISIYKTMNQSVQNNINAYNTGTLPLLTEIHAGFHNHGGN
ncbi:Dinitrogenase iron-molybdenum cofactor biosynthesis protein [Alkaliphilus metalliredigens QYMF]|uniref:Dinitrogenase iron-molybdenum cofactor biosynthesis protein n=1 Tax=Alkaliphilus metalliredigens (strain QYMF) TaxID=293826 RepID=A6TN95_ALKMQ|nr:NifB/NifX family molybdenum-iron cluster-binding protein [Alkaliphilus metalliredigens]ABR47663.1 Dinitrogenase iron-molybdenum cofactor biosynthesis protein [Alkaliphilus metalliredigens QYMF]